MSNVIDAIFAAVMLMVFAIFVVIGISIYDGIAGTGLLGTYEGSMHGFYQSLNGVAVFIAVAISLSAMFAAFFIRSHPVFFAISLFLIFIQFVLTPIFVDVYNGVAQGMSVDVQNEVAQQTAILQMLPVITAIGTVLAILVGIMRE